MTGRLIAFEGGEASGKSTQAARLAQRLGAVLTREPGGTPAGERIRSIVLDPGLALGARAEALLMAAARAQHVDEVIGPALAGGRHVVTDRFTGSSLAYQGWGRGLDVDQLRRLSGWATAGCQADLVVLLVVSPQSAALRQRRSGSLPDRLEAAGDDYHRRVAEGFSALAAADPDRWRTVDGDGDEDEVAARVAGVVDGWLGRR